MQPIPKAQYETLCTDVQTTAQLIDIVPDMDQTRSILSAYQPYLESGWVGFRTTTKPVAQRELSVRYIDLEIPHDAYAIALEKGFIADDGHPVHRLTKEMQDQLNITGYGVDVGVRSGMEKIWPFFAPAISPEQLFALPSCPPGLKHYGDYFAQHGLKWISLFALDYYHKTMNIYFMSKNPGHDFTPEQSTELVTDLGFAAPSEDEAKSNSQYGALYYTFDWESDACERIAFAVPHRPIDQFPTHLHPLFQTLMTGTPTLRQPICGSMQTAYAADPNKNYLKVEMDYSGMELSMVATIKAIPED